MSGIKYLLDTNFILGLLKATPEVIEIISHHDVLTSNCAYSAQGRLHLLKHGFWRRNLRKLKNWLAISSSARKVAFAQIKL